MKSLSEIETTSKRASRAIGYSWGEAEEIGKSIRLLELFGFPGVKHLNEYYKSKKEENFESIELINPINQSKVSSYCPIILGVNFIDQIRRLEPLEKCLFEKIGYPLLFLPFLSRASEIIGKKILFKFQEYQFLLNFNINISSNFFDNAFPLIASNVEITFLSNKDNFSDLEWQKLYKLSEETFVEESDSLKHAAAGAGLTDND